VGKWKDVIGNQADMRIRVLLAAGAFLACTMSVGALPQTHSEDPKTSSDPAVLFSKGQMALQSGDLDGAEKAFRQVLAIDPKAAAAYSNLGVIAMRRKDWDQALKLLGKAQKLAPKVSGVRLNIGLVYYREGDYASAIPALSSVLKDQPDSEQARYLLGLCDLFIQDYANGALVLEPLWPKKSNDIIYLYVLSITSSAAGRKELEEKALTRLVEVGGDTPEFHLLLGKAYLNRQETEKATAELQSAASVSPSALETIVRKRNFAGRSPSSRTCPIRTNCWGSFTCGRERSKRRRSIMKRRCGVARGWAARTLGSPKSGCIRENTSKRWRKSISRHDSRPTVKASIICAGKS
jgi:Flp pilus assembly protein TadD